jgi:pimeloyl-ACP methyl ester carboxylesterase
MMEVHLKHAFSACLFAILCAISTIARASTDGGYRITEVNSTAPDPDLRRTDFLVQQGHEALNRFHVVRVRQTGIDHLADSPVILLSPFGFPAQFWEVTKLHVYRDTFAARLALAGYDVWLVDDRLANVAPGGCESGAVDCSPMAAWGIDTAVDDALFVRDVVRAAHPLKRPVLGGFSGGSSTAIATVNREPRSFAGLLMWEGTIFTPDPAIRARNAAFCHDDEARLAAGVVADPSIQGFKTLFTLASAAPDAPSPIPVFPPGTTNLQALLFAFTVPNPTNPLSFTDTFVRLIGNPFTGLVYSDVTRLLELGPLVGNYAPVRFIRDSHCAIGGIDGSFSDNLDAFRGDVLVYAEGHGFGQMMIDTANQMTRAKVTLDFHPEFGESDPYFHVDWVHVAVDPLVNWLGHVRFVGR